MEQDAGNPTELLSLQTLTSLRSLVFNPSTSDSEISLVCETLTRLLQPGGDPAVLRHVLKLLLDLSSRKPDLAPRIFDSVRDNMLRAESTRLAAESLSVLASLAEQNRSLVPSLSEIDGEFFVSLCFGQPVSIRMWLLRNAERFDMRPYLLFTVFLGFTKDPYPYVRKEALVGLVTLSKTGDFESCEAVEGCYIRAVELLGDSEDIVRAAAVRAVSEWGKLLVATKEGANKVECSNAVFIQLCSVVRDMSVGVRVEVYEALGKMQIVSENILLQTLSKKVLGSSKENFQNHGSDESFEVAAAGVAGTFIHGLEDEFFEVRKSAVDSLWLLSVLSAEFANKAIILLMGMLYDDHIVIRLKALETLHHMEVCGHLRMQEMDMQAFLDTLLDKCENVRYVARRILKAVNLPDLKSFRQSTKGLLKSLDVHPRDELDIFSTLFHIGQNHGSYATVMIKMFNDELGAVSGSKIDLTSTRLAALLAMNISAPLSNKQNITCIPPQIFSYSLTMLGRLSRALSDIMDQDMLLAYLSQCSLLSSVSGTDSNNGKIFLHAYKSSNPNDGGMKISSLSKSLQETIAKESVKESGMSCKAQEKADSHSKMKQQDSDETRNGFTLMMPKIKAVWSLVLAGCIYESLRALRACKLELTTFGTGSLETAGAVEFAFQYIKVLKLLARVWRHVEPLGRVNYRKGIDLELLLGKLDKKLMEIRCRFLGLSIEEELHVLELVVLSCLLRLSKLDICGQHTTMNKFTSAVSRVEYLLEQGSTETSYFFKEIKKSLHEIGNFMDGSNCELLEFNKLIRCFTLDRFKLSQSLRHINAELDVPGNSYYNPLLFVSGLPVAIPCEITLYNITRETRLWLRVTSCEGSTQFIFLDSYFPEKSEEAKRFMFSAPFYKTPKVASFSVMVSMGVECLFEEVWFVKQGHGGPKHPLVYLCGEKEVHFSHVPKS